MYLKNKNLHYFIVYIANKIYNFYDLVANAQRSVFLFKFFFYSMCLQFEKPLQSLHFEIEKTFAFELKYYKQFFF